MTGKLIPEICYFENNTIESTPFTTFNLLLNCKQQIKDERRNSRYGLRNVNFNCYL